MAKRYNSNWDAKRLVVSFNQKQWRQDFAAFVREKKFWSMARVTRSKAISNNPLDRGIKSFEVYDRYGGSVKVTYQGDKLSEEINRSKAITDVASKIIDNGNLVLKAVHEQNEYGSRPKEMPRILIGLSESEKNNKDD